MPATDPHDPWTAPAADPASEWLPSAGGFAAVLVLHGAVYAGTWVVGLTFWAASFGVSQLLFLVPLVALLVWRRAPRPMVVGVFTGAALAFVLNVLWLAWFAWGASHL